MPIVTEDKIITTLKYSGIFFALLSLRFDLPSADGEIMY